MYNTSEEECNLELLKNPKQKGFLDEIQCAHIYLTQNQINDYFNIVLSHFQKDLPVECGHSILRSLCWVLSIDSYLNEFLDPQYEFPLLLPFSQKEYLDDVFDVLYIIVTKKPEAFDEQLIKQFNAKAHSKGYKSLTILSIYAQQFNDITDPYPMLDVLFNNFKRFSKIDVADKYASLLAILVQSYPEFRRDKGKKAWSVVCQLLDVIQIPNDINDKNSKISNILDIIASIYNSLSIIATYLRFTFSEKDYNEKNSIFNFDYVVEHFNYPVLHESIISFLLVVPLEYSQLKNKKFLELLLDDAQNDEKATFVLIRLAENKIIAQVLIEKLPQWMGTQIPTISNTLQLFLVIFQHKSLRPLISAQQEFVKFLLHIIDSKDDPEVWINIACKIIRRIELTDEILDEFCTNNVISSFMKVVQKTNTPNIITSGLLLLEKVASFGFRKELAQNCEWISDIIKDFEESDQTYIFTDAIDVATVMARHKKCSRKFADLGMIEYFEDLSKSKKFKKLATKFLNTIDRKLQS